MNHDHANWFQDLSLPDLIGVSNLPEWRYKLLHTLDLTHRGVTLSADYLTKADFPKQPHLNVFVNVMIHQSLSLVGFRLRKAGYDLSTALEVLQKDPKDNYDLILRTFFNRQDTPNELVPEFNAIKPSDFPTLRAYHTRIHYLKRRLGEVACPLPDQYAMWTMMNAFRCSNNPLDRDWINGFSVPAGNWVAWMKMIDMKASSENGDQGGSDLSPTALH